MTRLLLQRSLLRTRFRCGRDGREVLRLPVSKPSRKRYAVDFESSPSIVRKLAQVYAIGNDICAITEFKTMVWKGYLVTIYVRAADDWKIRLEYGN